MVSIFRLAVFEILVREIFEFWIVLFFSGFNSLEKVLRLRRGEFSFQSRDVLLFWVVLRVVVKLELYFLSLSAFFGKLLADARKAIHFLFWCQIIQRRMERF